MASSTSPTMEAEKMISDSDGDDDSRREAEPRGMSQRLRLLAAVTVLLCAAAAASSIIDRVPHEDPSDAQGASIIMSEAPDRGMQSTTADFNHAGTPQSSARSKPYPWPPAAGNFSITLSLTAVPSEAETIASAVAHLSSSIGYTCDVRQVVVDNDPARNQNASSIVGVLEQLVQNGTLTTYALVDYSQNYTSGGESVYQRIFGRPDGHLHSNPHKGNPGKGYLSYLSEIDTCKTDFLLHFDSDIRMYNSQERSPVLDLVSLVRAFPDVLATALPIFAGTDRCALDPVKDQAIAGRGVRWDKRGFLNLHDLSTQAYLMDINRLRNYTPIPMEQSVEDSFTGIAGQTVVAAMLPHYRPPFYFRDDGGHGERFAAEILAAPNMTPCVAEVYSAIEDDTVYFTKHGAMYGSEL